MIKIDIKKELHGSSGKINLDVDLTINSGDFIALTGHSGSGKTTLLRILANLEEAKGFISIDDEIWLDDTSALPTQKRNIGFVFQDYALFSNMSVLKNLLYVNNDKQLATHLLELTELTELSNRMPNTLSGGQKQRVALCRAMMNKPKLLLLDEPLSALDATMRNKLQNEILAIHKEFNTTTIMVSHDPSEIYKLSNRVIVLDNAEVKADGKAKEILLNTMSSQKFSFEGEILDIIKTDVIYIAIVSVGQQLVEIVLSQDEAKNLEIGKKIRVGTKAFSPTISF